MKFIVTSTLKTMTRNMRVNVVVVVTLLFVADLAFFPGDAATSKTVCLGLRFLQNETYGQLYSLRGDTHRILKAKLSISLLRLRSQRFF